MTQDALLAAFRANPSENTVRLVYADFLQENDEAAANAVRNPVVKRFGIDFNSGGGALTLSVSEVSRDGLIGEFTRIHDDGWTITGMVVEDWCIWVNDFAASHPIHGLVWGNFEREVYATSEEGYQHFYKHHSPNEWDYGDI